jgi:dipeptidyl aminopeptidase/acylaminoacyl peptidase
VCASDGSNTFQLTSLGEPETGSPHWSPDGQYIVFDSRHNGNTDIYVIKSTGGQPRRLTTDKSEDNTPFWSPDGKWIYFSSKRSGDWQVWKMPPEGGEAIQVTHQVGFGPVPSPDGKFIYYAKSQDMNVGLWRIAADGSNEEPVPGFDRKTWWCFAVTDSGIYFENNPSTQHPTLEFFDFKTKQYKTIITIDKPLASGVCTSPEGRWVFYAVFDRDDSDIMMAENFR